jgi:hypothetical protein
VERLAANRAQRRIGQRVRLPGREAIADPIGQVERYEQPGTRALQPLLRHRLNLWRPEARDAIHS